MHKISAELLLHDASLKSQHKLAPSLILKCKTINTEDTYVNFFIGPFKGREVISLY